MAAVANSPSHRIIQLTDFHLGRTADALYRGVNPAESLGQVLSHAGTHLPQPDGYILTGDLAEEASFLTYEQVTEAFKDHRVPIHFLPGNHDDPGLMYTCLSDAGFLADPVISYGNWRIILLNSAQLGSPRGKLGAKTLEWLVETLDCLKSCWIVIALHHHPIASESAWMDTMMIEDTEAFLNIIAAHGMVKAVVFGHVHQEIDRLQDNTRFLGTPSTCVQFAPKSQTFATDEARPGYRWIELHEDGRLSTQVMRLGAND
ncbi:MAG: cyclic phosphodiesterase [Pseudomonadota bacterium]|jgi:Icc protein